MASIVMTTARSQAPDPQVAAEALVRGLGPPSRLAVMFASSDRDQQALNAAVRARLPSATRLIGATTAGEIDHEGLHTGSVVLAGLAGDFEVGLGLGKHLSEAPIEAGAAAIAQACAELRTPPEDLDPARCVGLVIDDGFRDKKEELLIGMLDRNPDLVLVGGGASRSIFDPSAAQTQVHVDGEVATDAALVALFRSDAPWAALRSHWYEPTGQTLTITKVDDSCTPALEIDGQPAARRYAELLGVTVDELEFGLPRGFSERPTGVRVGREIFLRSPWKPLPDGSILAQGGAGAGELPAARAGAGGHPPEERGARPPHRRARAGPRGRGRTRPRARARQRAAAPQRGRQPSAHRPPARAGGAIVDADPARVAGRAGAADRRRRRRGARRGDHLAHARGGRGDARPLRDPRRHRGGHRRR